MLESIELLGGKLLAFEICSETLNAPRDMADVETDGRQAVRSRPDLRIGKFCGPMSEIFTGLRVRIQRRRKKRVSITARTGEPRFYRPRAFHKNLCYQRDLPSDLLISPSNLWRSVKTE